MLVPRPPWLPRGEICASFKCGSVPQRRPERPQEPCNRRFISQPKELARAIRVEHLLVCRRLVVPNLLTAHEWIHITVRNPPSCKCARRRTEDLIAVRHAHQPDLRHKLA